MATVQSSSTRRTGSNRVLLVDDDEALRLTLIAALELDGYDVTEAVDGADAVEQVRTADFDLVLMDVKMPFVDGFEAAEQIRARDSELPIVLMTAEPTGRLLLRALRLGVYTVAQKPMDVEGLLEVVANAITRPAVLVIDDSPQLAKTLVLALQKVGLRARAASDGDAAVNLFDIDRFDVCIIDLLMPRLEDGLKIADWIRKRWSDTIMLGITGCRDDQALSHFLDRGLAMCLRKPFDHDLLLTAIGHLRRRQSSPGVVAI